MWRRSGQLGTRVEAKSRGYSWNRHHSNKDYQCIGFNVVLVNRQSHISSCLSSSGSYLWNSMHMQIKDAHYKRSAVFSFLLRSNVAKNQNMSDSSHLTLIAHSQISILRTVIRDVFICQIVIVSSNAISYIGNGTSVVLSLLMQHFEEWNQSTIAAISRATTTTRSIITHQSSDFGNTVWTGDNTLSSPYIRRTYHYANPTIVLSFVQKNIIIDIQQRRHHWKSGERERELARSQTRQNQRMNEAEKRVTTFSSRLI